MGNIANIQVFKDSSLVIKWMTDEQNIIETSLLSLTKHVKDIFMQLTNLSFLHIYREFNLSEQKICKEGLDWDPRLLHI